MKRRQATLSLAALAALPLTKVRAGVRAEAAAGKTGRKILRVAFPVAETGFDPTQINDVYSRTVTPHIFEALYQYDYLARPVKIKPLIAAAMPEMADDYKTWTVRIQPGIYFADDPAFGGRRRELIAADFAFALKRFADPALKSPGWTSVEAVGYLGLAELRQAAMNSKQAFDYAREIDGARALDRYTIQYRIALPDPRFAENNLAASDLFGAVAHEVVQRYGDAIAGHPVGTGPFRLEQWRRSSLIVLERNSDYRERRWDAEPAADDAAGQAMLQRFKGRRLPLVDRVEVAIIEEAQPRWLAFLNGQIDIIQGVPAEFVNAAMPNGQVAPNLAKQGIRGARYLRPDVAVTLFNMDDPLVGGMTPDKVALRRAIGLGYDIDREIRLVRHDQAIPAQSVMVPHTSGYDPKFKSENSEYDPARAKALLDLYGYIDRDGDGWREQPDGQPLLLQKATQPDQVSRQLDELWQHDMKAIGLRMKFVTAKWPENLKAARAGKLMMWGVGGLADTSDGQTSLARLYGPMAGGQNMARFKLPAFDAIYDKLKVLPDGPRRNALFDQAKRIAVAYMPYKAHVHRYAVDMWHPWLLAYERTLFWQEWWHMVDIDNALRPR